MNGGLGAVYGGSGPHHRALNEPKYARWLGSLVYLPDLATTDLSGLDGLIVPERLHRGLLDRARPALRALLERGGTVVLFGEQPVYGDSPDGWLPGICFEPRPTNYWWWLDPEAPSGLVAAAPGHEFFDHVTLDDATWHQHGIFRAPADAEVLVATDTGEAVLYVDRVSTRGTLVVTSLDPMFHFGSYFMPATERFLDGFLPWVATSLVPSSTREQASD